MLSIVERRPLHSGTRDAEPVVNAEDGLAAEPSSGESTEFEIVMGRTQIASVLFVVTVIVVAFSAISYLAGKSLSPRSAAAVVAAPAQPIPAPPVAAAPAAAVPETPKKVEAPLFAAPETGSLYLQLGAVEKGVAIIMTEGLRKRGFESFVAPGPNDHIFRVMIGPLDADGYKSAKNAVEAIGLTTFALKHPQ